MNNCYKSPTEDSFSVDATNCHILSLADPLWQQTLDELRHDIYHLPKYVALEANRIKAIPEAILITAKDKIFFVPYLLRSCDNLFPNYSSSSKTFDAVSPYGYPGILINQAAANRPEFVKFAIEELARQLFKKNVCSAFLRLHPILNYTWSEIYPHCHVSGNTIAVDLKLSSPQIWHQTRPEHRTAINKSKRAGMSAKIVPFTDYIDVFVDIYNQTMNRVGAVQSYYFERNYFIQLFQSLPNQIHLGVVEWQDKIICGGIFSESCGIVQYHLGGTKTQFLKQAPSKLMFDYIRTWAKERGNEFLHLGGGVGGAKDNLYHFKAGFSKQSYTFSTLRLIVDQETYSSLTKVRAKTLGTSTQELLNSHFFPAYRINHI